jgi:hypothetical protein
MLGIVSAHASGYEEYLKELDELKAISVDARAKKPEIQLKIKGDYNELAGEINKYIDYFILVVDEKTPFNHREIDEITKSINQKSVKLTDKLKEMDRKSTVQVYANLAPMAVMGGILLTIQIAHELYDLCKEMKSDYEKYQIKKELTSYKWKR